MGKVAIVTDSNSGITQVEGKELGIFVVPMPFYINGKLYYEERTLSQEEFYQHCPRKNFIKNWQRMQRYLPHSHLLEM